MQPDLTLIPAEPETTEDEKQKAEKDAIMIRYHELDKRLDRVLKKIQKRKRRAV